MKGRKNTEGEVKEECGASDGREQGIRKQAFDWRPTSGEWCHYQACRGHPIYRAFVQTPARPH